MIIKIDLKMVKIQVFILSGIMVERILKFFSASDFFSFFFLLTSFWRFYVSFHSFLFRFLYVYVFFFFFVFCTAQDTDYPVETGTSNEAL